MTSVLSDKFVFKCGRGEVEAEQALIDAGGTFIVKGWIANHWSLIVWKLASLVRSKPDELKNWWNYEHALNQLKYRLVLLDNLISMDCIDKD